MSSLLVGFSTCDLLPKRFWLVMYGIYKFLYVQSSAIHLVFGILVERNYGYKLKFYKVKSCN